MKSWKQIEIFLTTIYNQVEKLGSYYYQGLKGGALPIDAPTYVYRKADDEIYQFLQSTNSRQRVCYSLAAPKMGKSSLMARTAKRLFDEGNICAQIALQKSGKSVNEENLFLSIARVICQLFKISGKSMVSKMEEIWQKDPSILPAEKFKNVIKYILERIGKKKIIIFIDDIEALISWQLQDSLMGLIRDLSESDAECFQRLTFVLLGGAKPEDLFSNIDYWLNAAKGIELERLEGDCQPLLSGLSKVSDRAPELMTEILFWTGGQPFLTQVLCDLVAKKFKEKLQINTNLKQQIEELVKCEIIGNWRNQNFISSHFQAIESGFITDGDRPDRIAEKINALNLYKRLLNNRIKVKFSEDRRRQNVLLLSGLAAKFADKIDVANPIYQEIFNRKWVEETQKIIAKQRTKDMPIAQAFNRDVFILIDRSGSMTIKDRATGDKTRWQYLQETVRGHIYEILNTQDDDYGVICNEVNLYFFNANKPAQSIIIRDAEQVQSKFKEKVPGGETFIGPTLEEALNQWFANRQDNKNAFIIIYTDGELSDRKRFVDLISSTCSRINSQDEIKILLIGIGSEIQLEGVIDFYLGIDLNVRSFKSRKGEDCNIFVFDLIDDVVDEGIVAALERQLEDDPRKGLASWIEERYPKLYAKYFGA